MKKGMNEMEKIKFENYQMMINKRAWEVAKNTGLEFEDLQAYGTLIYLYCLERYDPSKGKFSGILWLALGRLYEYAEQFKGRTEAMSEPLEYSIEARLESVKPSELLELAKEELERDAYDLLEWIIGRSWERVGRRKPTLGLVGKRFGWGEHKTKRIWNECKEFWNSKGWQIYG